VFDGAPGDAGAAGAVAAGAGAFALLCWFPGGLFWLQPATIPLKQSAAIAYLMEYVMIDFLPGGKVLSGKRRNREVEPDPGRNCR